VEKKTWQYHLIRCFGWFVQILPYSWLRPIGNFVGKIAYLVSGRHRERGISHVEKSLGYSSDEARNLIKKMYQHVGQSVLEVFYSPRLLKSPALMREIIDYEAAPDFTEWVNSKKGGIFITAHYGNWEWLAMRVAAEGVPVGTIVKFQPQPWVNALLNDSRRDGGVEVYPRTAAGTEILSGIRSIKKGRFLGLLCDQDGGYDGTILTFLGRPASTMVGPGIIAAKTGVPVFPAFIQRRPDGGHSVRVGSALPMSDDPVEVTKEIQKAIEGIIREKPEEWLWLQRRWNTPVPEKGDEDE